MSENLTGQVVITLINNLLQKFKKRNIQRLSAEAANNQFDRTYCRKRSAMVVSKYVVFILGSVDVRMML